MSPFPRENVEIETAGGEDDSVFGNLMNVVLSDHAQWRAAERVRMCHAEEILAEIDDAWQAGRVETSNPFGETWIHTPDCLYAVSADRRRAWVLTIDNRDPDRFIVKTLLVAS